MAKTLEELEKENLKLRELLWYHHGCPSLHLYHLHGDDGELQCACPKHIIDFKRMSVSDIELLLTPEPNRGILRAIRESR